MSISVESVVGKLASIIAATVLERDEDFVLASRELERRIIVDRRVFAQISDQLERIAKDLFPRVRPERAVAMLLANHLDAADAATPIGSSIHLGRDGFTWEPDGIGNDEGPITPSSYA
jgi:hypothetical protein